MHREAMALLNPTHERIWPLRRLEKAHGWRAAESRDATRTYSVGHDRPNVNSNQQVVLGGK